MGRYEKKMRRKEWKEQAILTAADFQESAAVFLMGQRRCNKSGKERMGPVGAGL